MLLNKNHCYAIPEFLFLLLCVTSEQRRNLRILYDALGTLADAVGAELNQVPTLSTNSSLVSCINHQELT